MTALRTNTATLVSMLPTDRVSGPIPLLWSRCCRLDRVSGHAFSHPPDIVGGLVDNRLRRVSAAAEIYKHIFCM